MEYKQFDFSLEVEPKNEDLIFRLKNHTSKRYTIRYPSTYTKRQVIKLLIVLFETESSGHVWKMHIAGDNDWYDKGIIWGSSNLYEAEDITLDELVSRVSGKLKKLWY